MLKRLFTRFAADDATGIPYRTVLLLPCAGELKPLGVSAANTPDNLVWLRCENLCGNHMLVDVDAYEMACANDVLVHCQSCQHTPAERAW